MLHEFRAQLSVSAVVIVLAAAGNTAADGFSWAAATDSSQVRSLPSPGGANAFPQRPRGAAGTAHHMPYPGTAHYMPYPGTARPALSSPVVQSNPHVAQGTLDASYRMPSRAGNAAQLAAARQYELRGDIGLAAQQYDRALQIDPRDRQALIRYARMKHRGGDLSGAVHLYRQSLVHFPQDPVALNDLALCYARMGDIHFAVATLSTAVQLRPDSKRYRNNLATVLLEANRQEEALATLVEGHGEAIAHFNLGHLLQRRGRHREAAEYLRAALAIDPSFTPASEMLAGLAAASGDRIATRPPHVITDRYDSHSPTAVTAGSSKTGPARESFRPGPPSASLTILPQSGQLPVGNQSRAGVADYRTREQSVMAPEAPSLTAAPDPESMSTPVLEALNREGRSALHQQSLPISR